jgi:hypothetical protein
VLAGAFLETYSTESLKVMARRRGLPEATTASKAKLIEFLGPRLFSRQSNRRLVQSLSDRQRHLLAALKARGGEAETVTLAAAVDGDARDVVADILDLVELGLLLYPRDGRSRKYRIGECERVWLDRTTADAVEPIQSLGPIPKLLASPPATVREAYPGLLLADVFVFLDHLEHHPVRPWEETGLADGDREKLRRSLLVTAEPPLPGLPAGDGRVRFLYLLLEETGLVKVRGGCLTPAERAAKFFHLEHSRQLRETMDAWQRLQGWNEFQRIPELVPRPVPDERKGVHTPSPRRVARGRARILSALRRFDPARWYAFSSLRREIKANHPDFLIRRDTSTAVSQHTYRGFGQRGRDDVALPLDLTADWDRVEGRFIARVLLESLHWLGVIDLGFDGGASKGTSDLAAFRVTPAGAFLLGLSEAFPELEESPVGLLVQPDFSLLLMSRAPDPGLLHDLSRFSRFAGGDRVARFELTRATVQRGFREGWTRERILDRLQGASGHPVPQNVVASLSEWEDSYDRFRIVSGVTLLEDPDGELPEPAASPRLHALLGPPVAPGIWRPAAGGVPDLVAGLRRRNVEVQRFDYAVRSGHVLHLGPGLQIKQHPRGRDWVTSAVLDRVARPADESAGLWRLDPRRAKDAMRDGHSPAALIRFLEARSRGSSPEIHLALETWGGEFEPVAAERAPLFICENPRLLELILNVPDLAALLGDRLSRDTYLIRDGRLTAFRRALRAHGIRLSDGAGLRSRATASPRSGREEMNSPGGNALPFRWTRREEEPGLSGAARADRQLRYLLARAIEARRKIRVEQRQGRRKIRRVLAPLALNGAFLSAYSVEARSERSYRLEGIEAVDLLPERF